VLLGWMLSRSFFHSLERHLPFLNSATPVSCQETAQSQSYSHRRSCGFIDPTYCIEQLVLRRWDISCLNYLSSEIDRADFSYAHMDLNTLVNILYPPLPLSHAPKFLQIHSTGFFLPWHRFFVQTLEDELRKQCGYNGVQPYWDWTKGNISHKR
jgi:hypothetical protein